MSGQAREREPAPLAGVAAFEEGDFRALSDGLAARAEHDGRRLLTRRKLASLGKEAAGRAGRAGVKLDTRSSLHRPTTFNGMKVRRLWTYLMRPKAEKTRLRRVLGADLARDLDAAYRNAYLCIAIEAEALEVSLRIHSDAWYDGQNLLRRVKAEGIAPWQSLLNDLDGFRLRMHDWQGEWRCGELGVDRLEEFLGYYVPGDHSLSVERRFPAPASSRGPALDPAAAEALIDECLRLVPLYRFTAWSGESDFLFG